LGDELTPEPDAAPPARVRDPRADVIGGLPWMQLITSERERAAHAEEETDSDDEQD
jgi:hypothetical protein